MRSSFGTSVLLLSISMVATGCRRRATPQPPSTSGTPATPTTPASPPSGTTPTSPTDPANRQVQISGESGGSTSVRTRAPAPATGCPALLPTASLGPGTVHNNSVSQNETWTLADSPHRLPEGINVTNNATLTIEPCAVVLVGTDNGIAIDSGSALMAVGTDAQHPIRIGSDSATPQPGDWRGVDFNEQARQTSRLVWVTIEHGGRAGWGDSCLSSNMAGLDVENVTTQFCRAFGISLRGSGAFGAQATNLRVTGTVAGDASTTAAVRFDNVDSVRTLPQGTYTGNARDEILVTTEGGHFVRTTSTWRNPGPGVRYHLADDLDVRIEGPTSPVLTIAPGTTIALGRGANITAGWEAEGGLIADGQTEATRISFTSAGTDTSPGTWKGIYFGERFNRSASRLNFVTVQSAASDAGLHSLCDWGEGSTDQAAIYILAAPNAQMIQHTRFVNLPPNSAAIGRAWTGAAVNFADAALGNDFAQAGTTCRQSPVSTSGCAENARCD